MGTKKGFKRAGVSSWSSHRQCSSGQDRMLRRRRGRRMQVMAMAMVFSPSQRRQWRSARCLEAQLLGLPAGLLRFDRPIRSRCCLLLKALHNRTLKEGHVVEPGEDMRSGNSGRPGAAAAVLRPKKLLQKWKCSLRQQSRVHLSVPGSVSPSWMVSQGSTLEGLRSRRQCGYCPMVYSCSFLRRQCTASCSLCPDRRQVGEVVAGWPLCRYKAHASAPFQRAERRAGSRGGGGGGREGMKGH